MAYSRQYPQNITPKGTSVQAGFENDDKEIKRILDILSNAGVLSLAGSKRQSVLYGATDSSGNPNFLTASGLTISIDGTAKPILLAFANGFSPTQGTVDLLDKIDSLISAAWTLPASNTCYLYIDKDISTGLLSYGYTTSADQYLKAAPSNPVLDQCYFNTNEMKMYHYNGSAWEVKQRIFMASVVTTASAATITMYPMMSKAVVFNNPELRGIVNLTGGQINFPAVRQSSANPNTLDDYEEGNWTPSFSGGSLHTGTATLPNGKYIKIGREIYVSGLLSTISAFTAGNYCSITGLPFLSAIYNGSVGIANASDGSAIGSGGLVVANSNTLVLPSFSVAAGKALAFNAMYITID